MAISRCPQCNLPATSEELQAGICPDCGAAFAVPVQAPPKTVKEPAPTSHWGLVMSAVAAAVFLVGGLGGFSLGAVLPLLADDDPGEPAAQVETPRVKELETLTQRLRRDLDAQKKQTDSANAAAEAAPKAERVNELEALTQKLGQNLDVQKKQAAAAQTRAEAAERDAESARADVRKPQPDDRVKDLELLAKKQQKDLESQIRQVKEAKVREESARRTTEQVRQESQRTIEQIRQERQRTIEQLRQENQRTVEAIRKQLNQQQQATQRALAEAAKQKQAAEDARRKNP